MQLIRSKFQRWRLKLSFLNSTRWPSLRSLPNKPIKDSSLISNWLTSIRKIVGSLHPRVGTPKSKITKIALNLHLRPGQPYVEDAFPPPPPSIPPGNEDIVGTSGQHGKSLRMSATPKLIIHKWHKSPRKSEKGKSENAKGLKGYRLVCSILASGITQKIFTLPLNSQLFPQFSFDILLMDLAWRIWIPKWLWGGRTHICYILLPARLLMFRLHVRQTNPKNCGIDHHGCWVLLT